MQDSAFLKGIYKQSSLRKCDLLDKCLTGHKTSLFIKFFRSIEHDPRGGDVLIIA